MDRVLFYSSMEEVYFMEKVYSMVEVKFNEILDVNRRLFFCDWEDESRK